MRNYKSRVYSVHIARLLYGINWMDIAPALSYIRQSFLISTVEIGALVASFYTGLFAFQFLGGYLSSLIGDKTTSLTGIILVGIFAITSGLSTNFPELLLSRFLAGLAAALFFSPALSLLASIVPAEKYTFHVGIYNASYAIGSGIGVAGWSIMDIYVGYKNGFIIAGIATVFLFIMLTVLLKDISNVKTHKKDIVKSIKMVLSSKLIPLVALIGGGTIIAYTIMGQFFVYYLEYLKFGTLKSGYISSLFLLIGFIGGVVGGYHYSRTKHKLAVFIILNVLISILLIIVGFVFNIILIIIVVILMGMLAVYGFSVIYAIIRNLSRRDLVSLSISYTNTVQLAIAAIVPVIFTYLSEVSGYKTSWIAMGIISLALISLIIPAKKVLYNKIT